MMRLISLAALAAALSATPHAYADDEREAEIELIVATAGEVLAVNDLCEWDLLPKIEAAFVAGAKKLKLPQREQQSIRARVNQIRTGKFGNLSAGGRARTISELCTRQERLFLDKLIAEISFD